MTCSPAIEQFLREVLKMGDAGITEETIMFRLAIEIIERWEQYKVDKGSNSHKEVK